MVSKSLQATALLGLLALPTGPIAASNPHTVDGQDCSDWKPTAPLSERIRQVRSCEGFKAGKAMQLAEEFEAGSRGLPTDWGQAATWYRETIKIATALPQESLAARRADGARQRLAQMLQTGGPGLRSDPVEAQRLMPINIRPGQWEFTSRTFVDGKELATENGGRESFCVTEDDLATASPFAVSALTDNYRAHGCRIGQVRVSTLDAEINLDCEEHYDEEWDESVGQTGKLTIKYQGEAADIALVATRYPEGTRTEVLTKGRRTRAC